jgi:hypothetical protein
MQIIGRQFTNARSESTSGCAPGAGLLINTAALMAAISQLLRAKASIAAAK